MLCICSLADTLSFVDQLQMSSVVVVVAGWLLAVGCVEPTHLPNDMGLLTGFRFRLREGVGCLFQSASFDE